jgi:hypothetical protein
MQLWYAGVLHCILPLWGQVRTCGGRFRQPSECRVLKTICKSQVIVILLRVNVNNKVATVEELVARRKVRESILFHPIFMVPSIE